MSFDSNTVGLALIGLVLAAYGVRIWSRGRPDRRRWRQAATIVIVVVLLALLAALMYAFFLQDPLGD